MDLITPTRRGFLGAVMLAATAPAILRQGVAMPIRRVIAPSGSFMADLWMRGFSVEGVVLMDVFGTPDRYIPFTGGPQHLIPGDQLTVTAKGWVSTWRKGIDKKPVLDKSWFEPQDIAKPIVGQRIDLSQLSRMLP